VLRIKYLLPAALLSLFYNFVILLSVTLNFEWVRTRAAGGQYESFPPTLRIIYLAVWLWDHKDQKLDAGSRRLAKILSVTFLISTVFQLISRSPDERWNAIPAFILAITFFTMLREVSKS
jgi:hypothetical protein